MVGVPAFSKWVSGPKSRTFSPICRTLRRLIMRGPTTIEIASAVRAPRMARIVR